MLNIQRVVNDLSWKENIPIINITVVHQDEMYNKKAIAECYPNKRIIKINQKLMSGNYELMCSVFHEWRHWWQYWKYKEVFLWWKENWSWYSKVYFSMLCAIEVDARFFGVSLGLYNGESFLRKKTDLFQQEMEADISEDALHYSEAILRANVQELQKLGNERFPALMNYYKSLV